MIFLSNKEKKLAVKVFAELLRVKQETGINFYTMPDSELERWVKYFIHENKR